MIPIKERRNLYSYIYIYKNTVVGDLLNQRLMLNVNLLCFLVFFLLFLLCCFWRMLYNVCRPYIGTHGEHLSKTKKIFLSALISPFVRLYIGRDIDKKRVGHRFDLTNHIKACRCKAFISILLFSLYLALFLIYIYKAVCTLTI